MLAVNDTTLELNADFKKLASDEQVAQIAKTLEANGMKTVVVENGEEAKKFVLDMVPQGVEIYVGQSQTLEKLGLPAEFDKSGRYDAIRPKVFALDRKTQGDEIRKLRASPDYFIGSVQAITETGQVLISSFGGSQLSAYAYGSAKVIWVVGTQKLVKDLDEGLRRIEEYCLPSEDTRLLTAFGIHSANAKTLIVNREVVPGRITIVLVKEEIGI
ncbi:MAG: lactate utilization protein [Chloroflexi bacterium]|nr:lactate utilization protein [Chloroflexota bacterium]